MPSTLDYAPHGDKHIRNKCHPSMHHDGRVGGTIRRTKLHCSRAWTVYYCMYAPGLEVRRSMLCLDNVLSGARSHVDPHGAPSARHPTLAVCAVCGTLARRTPRERRRALGIRGGAAHDTTHARICWCRIEHSRCWVHERTWRIGSVGRSVGRSVGGRTIRVHPLSYVWCVRSYVMG